MLHYPNTHIQLILQEEENSSHEHANPKKYMECEYDDVVIIISKHQSVK